MDLTFDLIDAELMELYEAWMLKEGLTRNTTSFYMRILRTNYKLAVEKGLTTDRHPFRHVYCGMDKTIKRSLPLDGIKKIKNWICRRSRDWTLQGICSSSVSVHAECRLSTWLI